MHICVGMIAHVCRHDCYCVCVRMLAWLHFPVHTHVGMFEFICKHDFRRDCWCVFGHKTRKRINHQSPWCACSGKHAFIHHACMRNLRHKARVFMVTIRKILDQTSPYKDGAWKVSKKPANTNAWGLRHVVKKTIGASEFYQCCENRGQNNAAILNLCT